jgi:hypothetical protein
MATDSTKEWKKKKGQSQEDYMKQIASIDNCGDLDDATRAELSGGGVFPLSPIGFPDDWGTVGLIAWPNPKDTTTGGALEF